MGAERFLVLLNWEFEGKFLGSGADLGHVMIQHYKCIRNSEGKLLSAW